VSKLNLLIQLERRSRRFVAVDDRTQKPLTDFVRCGRWSVVEADPAGLGSTHHHTDHAPAHRMLGPLEPIPYHGSAFGQVEPFGVGIVGQGREQRRPGRTDQRGKVSHIPDVVDERWQAIFDRDPWSLLGSIVPIWVPDVVAVQR
jgi:hypothetical protein